MEHLPQPPHPAPGPLAAAAVFLAGVCAFLQLYSTQPLLPLFTHLFHVTKASAGASEHLPIARVTNIARTVEELKERNIWTVGLDERGKQTYDALDYNMDCALILGAEGKGLHDLVKKKCDFLVSIPMLGKVPSLNVSVAGAVVMYEIVRQRRAQDRDKDREKDPDQDRAQAKVRSQHKEKDSEASVGAK